MARKNKKNKDIQKAEMPKVPEKRPFDEDTLDFVQLEVYRKEKGELHEQDPRKPINAEGGGGPERLDLLKRLSVFRGKGDTPVKKAAEGGSMTKQMEMFEDGGLKDEGGMTDEVSGNDVPIGSTREEVRDDIPAQLSEGEFVFPADVVRFMGLEKLMMLRQKAKEGLKKMEDMGQMGNSEEATLPDDMPFDMDDLDMEDDKEEEVADSNFNRGGVVTMAEGGTTPTTENTDLKFNQGGTTKSYGDYYKFKMPGSSDRNNFTKPYTQDGKQYVGFRPLMNGRVAAYRMIYANYDDEDAGKLSYKMDILEGDTKFSLTNPQTDIDPPMNRSLTVTEMADIKDGTVSSRYTSLPNQVYYKSLREYTSQKTPSKEKLTYEQFKQSNKFFEPVKEIPSISPTSSSNINQIESKNTKTPQINNISTSTPPVNQLTKTNEIKPNESESIESKTPQGTMVQQEQLNTDLNVKQTGVPTRAGVGTNSNNLNVKQTGVPTRAGVGTNSNNLNVKQTGVPTRGNTNATPTDTSLNARQANVPTARPTNLVGTDTTNTTDTKTIDFRSFVPKDLGNRYQNKIQSVVDNREAARAEAQQNYDDALNQDAFKSIDISSEADGDNDNTDSPSSGLDLGGNIEHSLTDYTALNDNLKEVHKDFVKAQYNILSPALSLNPFGLATSAIGLKFSEQTKGATYFGAVGKAELGKAKATAYNMAAIEVQRSMGLLNNNTISTWSNQAQNMLASRAANLMSFVTDVHNSKYGIEVPDKEEKPNAYSNAINTAKGYYSKAFGKVTAPIASVKITELSTMTSKNTTKAYMQQVMELARNSLEDKAREAEEERNTVDYGFDDVSITAELSDYGFNVSARDSINVNGGLKGYGFDANGNRYGITVSGNVVNQLGKVSNVRAFISLPQVQSSGVGKGQTTEGGAFGLDPEDPSYGSITDFGKAMSASGKSGYYGSIGQAINDVNDKTGKISVERATKAFHQLSILGINPLDPTAEPGITTPNDPDADSYGIDTNPGKDTDPMGNPTDVPSTPSNTTSGYSNQGPTDDDDDYGGYTDDDFSGLNTGGLVSKKKKKKMKRGGLASR